ncbi:hypothetical protein CTKZ_11730 [Cellulomonas algicola]|uniref:Peptidoglycan binding-like domain-containing protein n=2 Tax=Cellulomonas algicola TaxID=2071633 RepID=A0A401UY36_9CELL|nr:hypothetical protein CTKZ_11730 [Cellulomonas algicola]
MPDTEGTIRMSARTSSRARRGASAAAAAILTAALTAVATVPASAVPPAATVTVAPAALSNDDTPNFAGTTDGLGGVVDITIDGATTSTPSDPLGGWEFEGPALADGPHTYSVDYAGGQIASGTFTVDTEADISVTPPVFERPGRHTTATSLTFGVTSEPGATVTYSLDGDEPVVVTGSTVQLTGLTEGYHFIDFAVVDAAGNHNGTAWDWTVDSSVVAPSVPETLSFAATVDEQTTIDLDDHVTAGTHTVTGFDAWTTDGEALGFQFDWEDTHVVTLYPRTAGTFTFTFSVWTEEGEQSNESTVTVDVAEAPLVSASWLAKPDASTTSTTARFAVATDPGATLEYVVDLPEGAQSVTPVEVDGTEFTLTGLAVGRHTIRVYAVADGHYSQPLDYVWEVVATGSAPAQPTAPAAPAPSAPAPVLSKDAIPAAQIAQGVKRGATGPSVVIIQRIVGTPQDGVFGPATRAAVVAFQRTHGLVADGIVGPRTWAVLVQVANGGTGVRPVVTVSIPQVLINRGISSGATGQPVVLIQRAVGAQVDGRFGPRTTVAVKAFQKAHGLVADGIVGRLTWAKILEVGAR